MATITQSNLGVTGVQGATGLGAWRPLYFTDLDGCALFLAELADLSASQQEQLRLKLSALEARGFPFPCKLSQQQLANLVAALRSISGLLRAKLSPLAASLPVPTT